jgi:hypothetical protein
MSHTELVKYSGTCQRRAPDLPVPKHVEPSVGDLSDEPDAHTAISWGSGTYDATLAACVRCATPLVHHLK